MDLGECPKVHDLALRADYEAAAKDKDYFYDVDVSIYLFVFTVFFPVPLYYFLPKNIAHK